MILTTTKGIYEVATYEEAACILRELQPSYGDLDGVELSELDYESAHLADLIRLAVQND
jgi:uncharacterized lipoprotein YehR (DUF1307 family)